MFYVYIFQHKQNNKIYVGKTNNPKGRFLEHKSSAKNPKFYFARALAKYGIESFQYEIIQEYLTEQESLEAEKFWIKHFNSKHKTYGYNLTEGGQGLSGFTHKPESIKKMSDAQLANHEHNSAINSGENNPNCKLRASEVFEISQLLIQNQLTILEIANKFCISKAQINRIRAGVSWQQTEIIDQSASIYKNDGENNPRARMTEELVINMRVKHAEGMGYIKLSRLFGVSPTTVRDIVKHRTWKNVHQPFEK